MFCTDSVFDSLNYVAMNCVANIQRTVLPATVRFKTKRQSVKGS